MLSPIASELTSQIRCEFIELLTIPIVYGSRSRYDLIRMAFFDPLVHIFPPIYGAVNRTGVLQRPWAEALFQRAYFAYKRVLEDPFFRLTRRKPELFRDGLVLDIGANIGYTACVFAEAAGPNGRVIAFEPDSDNFAQLNRIVHRAGLSDRITPVEAAVGEQDGSVTLWHNRAHHGDHRIATEAFRDTLPFPEDLRQVRLLAIDTFLPSLRKGPPLRFIKVDVQGYELSVCRGMSQTLASHPEAVVALEYFPASMEEMGFQSEELLSFLEDRSYQLYRLTGHGIPQKVEPQDLSDSLGSKGYSDFLASRYALD